MDNTESRRPAGRFENWSRVQRSRIAAVLVAGVFAGTPNVVASNLVSSNATWRFLPGTNDWLQLVDLPAQAGKGWVESYLSSEGLAGSCFFRLVTPARR